VERAFHLPAALRSSEGDTTEGIGIFFELSSRTLHTGILYVNEAGEWRALHLEWHHRLVEQAAGEVSPKASIAVVDLPRERAVVLAEMCSLVWEKFKTGRSLPYALRWTKAGFAQDGRVALAGGQVGFTCATFVLALFDSAGLSLVQTETWPQRADDVSRQEEFVALLKAHGADGPHVLAVQAEIGCVRFRPEEVTNAGLFFFEERPVAFESVATFAANMKAYVAKSRHPPTPAGA
jgi:hypothetical protein